MSLNLVEYIQLTAASTSAAGKSKIHIHSLVRAFSLTHTHALSYTHTRRLQLPQVPRAQVMQLDADLLRVLHTHSPTHIHTDCAS